jgi:hypothetical protein
MCTADEELHAKQYPWWSTMSHDHVDTYAPAANSGQWDCMDCGLNTHGEYYMVQMDVWAQAVGERGGKLCVDCIEQRLGRRLEPADFLPCPANDPDWRKTPRLLERLTG